MESLQNKKKRDGKRVTDGQTDGQIDGRTDKQRDRRRRSELLVLLCLQQVAQKPNRFDINNVNVKDLD